MITAIGSVAIIALLGLGAVVLLYGRPSPAAPDPIRIGGPALEQNALICVAMEQGLFEKNSLAGVRPDAVNIL